MASEQPVARQGYSTEAEDVVNKQINMELYASYVYLGMAAYFGRSDVALPHISRWMKNQSDDEREHAMILMQYQSTRGGKVKMFPVDKPEKDSWDSALEAFEAALGLEKRINEALLGVHAVGDKNKDPHLCGFIEEKFLREQVKSIDEIARFITILRRAGKGLGEYIFDTKNFEESEETVVNEAIAELSHH